MGSPCLSPLDKEKGIDLLPFQLMVKEGELMNSKWAQSSIEEALTVLWIPQERNEPTVYLKDHSIFFLGHIISKVCTIAQLFQWSWEKATFKCSNRAHWKVVKGRMIPKTSNIHLYIKKKGGQLGAALKNKKSSLLQALTTSLQESSGFASFT